jgi:hypothetical protein
MRLMGSLGSTSCASYAFCATSAWLLLDIGGWLDQVKDAPVRSKSSSKLPSLCSTQPHIKELFAQVLTTMGRATYVPGDPVNHHDTV